MLIKNYNFDESAINSFIVDETSGEFLWISFSQDASGNCALQKVSAHNPLQKYFDIDIAVDEITRMYISSSYIYLAYDDDTYIGARYSLANPLTTYTNFSLPVGITEAPIDVLVNGSYVFYLIPGNTSGTNAKIVVLTTSGTYSETIDLSTITNAIAFSVDDSDNIWVLTNESPSKLVRVYDDGGYTYTITTLGT